DFSLVEFIAPDDDGLEGERALAQAGDHRFAAGLDSWRSRFRPRARGVPPNPFRVDTCALDYPCDRSAPWPRTWLAPRVELRPVRRFRLRPLLWAAAIARSRLPPGY